MINLKHLVLICEAINKIHELTETDIHHIVDALTGIAWGQDFAGLIKSYLAGYE
jgi:hypothetical protein